MIRPLALYQMVTIFWTIKDVDITTQNLDEAIQAIDESELSQDSLSDEALGL